MCLMGQVYLSELKLSSKGNQKMVTSQKRSMGRNLVSHMLRGQNGGFTNMPLFGRDHKCKECE